MARVVAAGRRGRRTLVAAAVLFAGLAATAAEPAGSAVKFTVTSTADEPDVAPGNGFCLTAARECTLRAAVQEANATGVGGSVVLTPGAVYVLTRTGLNEDQAATGDLDLTGNVMITVLSGRAAVQGASGWVDRIFDVSSGSAATLHALDVMGGHPSTTGGGIRNKGGTLTLTDTTVSGNSSGFGGGIDNGGTVTMTGSAVRANTATSAAGILNSGTLTLGDSTVADNAASSSSTSIGGGILNNGGALTLRNSTISGNSTSSTSNVTSTVTGGGGIFNENGGAVTLTNSTVADNSALGLLGHGAGIYNDRNPSFFDNNTLTVTRSTIRDNQGGGIVNSDELTVAGSAVRATAGAGSRTAARRP